MIGVYDYTVIVTYLSTVLGIIGAFLAMEQHSFAAIVLLLICGLCDAVDGRIARTKKNRTDAEMRFGIQIDSLNDLVCFGILPAAIGVGFGFRAPWYLASMVFLPVCAMIRLAFFNVTEEERQASGEGKRSFYLGLPVTSVAVLAPLLWVVSLYTVLPMDVLFSVGYAVIGFLFILPVHVPKPNGIGIVLLSLIGAAELAALLHLAGLL